MKRVHIYVVAAPGERGSPDSELQPGEVDQRAGGHMLTGDPFGINQSHRVGGGYRKSGKANCMPPLRGNGGSLFPGKDLVPELIRVLDPA